MDRRVAVSFGGALRDKPPERPDHERGPMILRFDRVGVALPPPSDPDPAGAQAVQELLGGKFGEMSTWLNYTFQSFNFRGRQGARPFYDLLASIATEEFGHVELVCATINTMLTGASPTDDGRAPEAALAQVKGVGNPHYSLAGDRARSRKTPRADPGTATTSSRRATSSRT